ncbi:hypothetical protein LJR296_005051 [Cupriavidus necator]|uniref:hypothetical protein n=1 Tax=Cupriavidus necator TaxID=106590 RepID=UPI003ECC828A
MRESGKNHTQAIKVSMKNEATLLKKLARIAKDALHNWPADVLAMNRRASEHVAHETN